MIGFTPAALAARKNLTAENRFPHSVTASAGTSATVQVSTRGAMRTMLSTSEYSVRRLR